MRILLFRHGEPQTAVEGLVAGGGTDAELSERGWQMTVQNAQYAIAQDVEAIITTGMRRTDPMGSIINAESGKPHIVDEDLRELHLGDLEGGTWKQFKEDHPQYPDWITGYPLGNAETVEQIAERVSRAYQRILALPYERIALNAHWVINMVLMNDILKHQPRIHYKQEYGCVNVLIANPEPQLERCNEIVYDPRLLAARDFSRTPHSCLSGAKTHV